MKCQVSFSNTYICGRMSVMIDDLEIWPQEIVHQVVHSTEGLIVLKKRMI